MSIQEEKRSSFSRKGCQFSPTKNLTLFSFRIRGEEELNLNIVPYITRLQTDSQINSAIHTRRNRSSHYPAGAFSTRVTWRGEKQPLPSWNWEGNCSTARVLHTCEEIFVSPMEPGGEENRGIFRLEGTRAHPLAFTSHSQGSINSWW